MARRPAADGRCRLLRARLRARAAGSAGAWAAVCAAPQGRQEPRAAGQEHGVLEGVRREAARRNVCKARRCDVRRPRAADRRPHFDGRHGARGARAVRRARRAGGGVLLLIEIPACLGVEKIRAWPAALRADGTVAEGSETGKFRGARIFSCSTPQRSTPYPPSPTTRRAGRRAPRWCQWPMRRRSRTSTRLRASCPPPRPSAAVECAPENAPHKYAYIYT